VLKLVLASNNPRKLVELSELFAQSPLEIVAQSALGIAEAEEPHASFVENALAKARHAARHASAAAIADDSGLCVDALGGAPGVYSAHFAPLPASNDSRDREAHRAAQDSANNSRLLEVLRGHTDRRARYVNVLVALRQADDPEPLIAFGRWEGNIVQEPRGSGGFGYDPLMFIPALECTVAELDRATKNEHSHRALAARQMIALMREVWRV
jgi:XTP/dITP diphosphohydrolase